MFNNKYVSFTLIVLITFSASAIGGVVTSAYKEPWYSQIIQPSFSPPSWVFGPVWTTLYFFHVHGNLVTLGFFQTKKKPHQISSNVAARQVVIVRGGFNKKVIEKIVLKVMVFLTKPYYRFIKS